MKAVRTVSEADLARLKEARHDADGRYNEGLTALDAAVQALPDLPAPPPAPDETQVTPLNERWAIARAVPAVPGGWRGRLAAFVLRFVQPALDQQQAFNAAVVDHINRNVVQQRAASDAAAALIDIVRHHAEHLAHFESCLILYLQQVTPFVDTKDYEFAALATRITEDVADAHDELARTVRGLAAALSGASDQLFKRLDRSEVRSDAGFDELRTSLASLQLAVHALRRELAGARERGTGDARLAEPRPVSPVAGGPPASSGALSSDPLSSHKYVAFEDKFRGDRALIRTRQQDYVPLFAGRQDVLDLGCGRGEFLQLLRDAGIRARGIDTNHEMVASCVASGLDVAEADALTYLRGRADGELGGLIAAQVVEHLEPDYLLAVLDEAFRALAPGSPLVLETINVASWFAFFSSYIRDLTHVRPLHPDTLKFVVVAAGFLDVEVQLRAPLPDSGRLAGAPDESLRFDPTATSPEGRGLLGLARAFDLNMAHLNSLLFAPLDYAVVAWKR